MSAAQSLPHQEEVAIPGGHDLEAMIYPEWRHKHKGGRYRIEAIAQGAGELHGQPVVFYSDLPRPTVIYARKLAEWHHTMETINAHE